MLLARYTRAEIRYACARMRPDPSLTLPAGYRLVAKVSACDHYVEYPYPHGVQFDTYAGRDSLDDVFASAIFALPDIWDGSMAVVDLYLPHDLPPEAVVAGFIRAHQRAADALLVLDDDDDAADRRQAIYDVIAGVHLTAEAVARAHAGLDLVCPPDR